MNTPPPTEVSIPESATLEPVAQAKSVASTAPTGSRPPFFARFVEWFWRGKAITAAKASQAQVPAEERVALEQARALLDLAERVRDRVVTVSTDDTDLAASLLLQQGLRLLLSTKEESAAESREAYKELLPPAEDGQPVAEEHLQALAQLRSHQPIVDSLRAKDQSAAFARALQHALLQGESSARKLEALRAGRAFRVFVCLLLVLGLVLGGMRATRKAKLGPNLLAGKPWETSSTQPDNLEAHKIFFHTRLDDSPWVKFDLGSVMKIRQIEIKNRESFTERAVPLVVELSTDGNTWKEVARKNEPFTLWMPKIAATDARYLRARALKKTKLHLSWVRAY